MLRIGQAPRAVPLTPEAVLAVGASALGLARRLLQLTDTQLARLRGLAGSELALVLGAADDLPWSEGVAYLAREPSAPELYLPCATEPDVPATLLLRALARHCRVEQPSLPLAVSLEPPLVVSVAPAQ